MISQEFSCIIGDVLQTSPIFFCKGLILMKKIIAALAAALMISVFTTGCFGMGQKTAVATGDEALSQEAADYENNFEGLCNYLASFGYINPVSDNEDVTYVSMDYELVGADKGRKFTEQTKKKATIEIYEFNTDKKNATADEVIKSVKNDGVFKIYDLPEVKALLSDNGKYMMIYTDKSINEENTESDEYKLRDEIVTKFKEFHK